MTAGATGSGSTACGARDPVASGTAQTTRLTAGAPEHLGERLGCLRMPCIRPSLSRRLPRPLGDVSHRWARHGLRASAGRAASAHQTQHQLWVCFTRMAAGQQRESDNIRSRMTEGNACRSLADVAALQQVAGHHALALLASIHHLVIHVHACAAGTAHERASASWCRTWAQCTRPPPLLLP